MMPQTYFGLAAPREDLRLEDLERLVKTLARQIRHHLGLDGWAVTQEQALNLARQQAFAVAEWCQRLGMIAPAKGERHG